VLLVDTDGTCCSTTPTASRSKARRAGVDSDGVSLDELLIYSDGVTLDVLLNDTDAVSLKWVPRSAHRP
jgi:hypothetical protein